MCYMGLTDLTGSYNDLTAFLSACDESFIWDLTDLTGSYNDLTAFLSACGDGRGARFSTVCITGALYQIASRRHLGEYLGDISANTSANIPAKISVRSRRDLSTPSYLSSRHYRCKTAGRSYPSYDGRTGTRA